MAFPKTSLPNQAWRQRLKADEARRFNSSADSELSWPYWLPKHLEKHKLECGMLKLDCLIKDLDNVFPRRQWHPTPVLLPGKSHGRRSLVGCSLWGRTELDTTERLHFHFSLSCIGEGNGNPLQCSYLENPSNCGAWWAPLYGVAQSRTRLKRLSSSSRQCF